MAGTTATSRVASKSSVHALSESDLQLGIAEIENVTAVKRWKVRGTPDDDIEMEIPNIISNKANNVAYQRMCRRVCDAYDINERELVRQLLHRMKVR